MLADTTVTQHCATHTQPIPLKSTLIYTSRIDIGSRKIVMFIFKAEYLSADVRNFISTLCIRF